MIIFLFVMEVFLYLAQKFVEREWISQSIDDGSNSLCVVKKSFLNKKLQNALL